MNDMPTALTVESSLPVEEATSTPFDITTYPIGQTWPDASEDYLNDLASRPRLKHK